MQQKKTMSAEQRRLWRECRPKMSDISSIFQDPHFS